MTVLNCPNLGSRSANERQHSHGTNHNIHPVKPQEMNMGSHKWSKASIICYSKNPSLRYIEKYEDTLQNPYLENN